MDRDVILLAMTLALGGPIVACLGAWVRPLPLPPRSGREAEARSWRRLLLPLIPGVLIVSFLAGWALQEPDSSDERIGPAVAGAAVLWSPVLVRAVWRALRSMRRHRVPVAATSGMLTPRVQIDPLFERALDDDERRAVEAHEAAHARHRDPLRLWLAQLFTDLQWPAPRATERWRQWRHWLEVARDEEARETGADGAALASAVLTAARLEPHPRPVAAGLGSEAILLQDRVRRLLRPLEASPLRPNRAWLAAFAALVVAVAVTGIVCGDAVLHRLLGMTW